jgi:hypothetical protein
MVLRSPLVHLKMGNAIGGATRPRWCGRDLQWIDGRGHSHRQSRPHAIDHIDRASYLIGRASPQLQSAAHLLRSRAAAAILASLGQRRGWNAWPPSMS